jgi:hypothetical protein
MSSRIRRALVAAYCILTLTLLCAMLASLSVLGGDLTRVQFKLLLALAVGMMLQVALFAFIFTPVAMRGGLKQCSFVKAAIVMESCALIAIAMLALALVGLLRH